MSDIRITKFLSECGECSRRKAEELIHEGKVKINGIVVKDLSAKVIPGTDRVQVGSRTVRVPEKGVILFHKPRGVVATLSDPEGRKCLTDFLTKHYASYVPVGRLDYDSSGLLILTNDGDLANRLMHPKYGFDRIYEVRVRGSVTHKTCERLQRGVKLEDGVVFAKQIVIVSSEEGSTRLKIAVGEGKNRMVRRMFDSVGHPVMRLKRIQHGPLSLGGIQGGEIRKLSQKEYEVLRRRVFDDKKKGKPTTPQLYVQPQKKNRNKTTRRRVRD